MRTLLTEQARPLEECDEFRPLPSATAAAPLPSSTDAIDSAQALAKQSHTKNKAKERRTQRLLGRTNFARQCRLEFEGDEQELGRQLEVASKRFGITKQHNMRLESRVEQLNAEVLDLKRKNEALEASHNVNQASDRSDLEEADEGGLADSSAKRQRPQPANAAHIPARKKMRVTSESHLPRPVLHALSAADGVAAESVLAESSLRYLRKLAVCIGCLSMDGMTPDEMQSFESLSKNLTWRRLFQMKLLSFWQGIPPPDSQQEIAAAPAAAAAVPCAQLVRASRSRSRAVGRSNMHTAV